MLAGASAPICGRPPSYAHHFHGPDGFGSIHSLSTCLHVPDELKADIAFLLYTNRLEAPKLSPSGLFYLSPRSVVDEYIHQLSTVKEDSLTIITLGPLTNIAMVHQRDPEILSKAKEIISMGGNLNFPGNVTPFAEFNVWSDAKAVEIVLDATKDQKINLTLVPLNGILFLLISSYN